MTYIAMLLSVAGLSLALLIRGCDLGALPTAESKDQSTGNPSSVQSHGFLIRLAVTDTTGQLTTRVRTGEVFDIHGSLTNQTGASQVYSHTGPVLFLEIWQADSMVTYNFYGLAWPQVVVRDTLANQASLTMRWRAPLTPGQYIVLTPGSYTAQVSIHTLFGDSTLQEPQAIPFTVVE